jgi:hypothetical protein
MYSHHIADGNRAERNDDMVALLPYQYLKDRGAVTGAKHVGANNKVFICIKGGFFSNQSRPPARYICVPGKCMADPDDIIPFVIEFAMRMIANVELIKN